MDFDANIEQDLRAGLKGLGLSLSDETVSQFLQLIEMLAKWNRAYNLTAITEPAAVIRKHFLDSLSIHDRLQGPTMLDVGTGGGFPGLPLAMIRPDLTFTLLDSHAKKLRFIDHVAATFNLHNVTTVHARVEAFTPAQRFDTITSRAFSSVSRFAGWIDHLLGDEGVALAMKGRLEQDDHAALGAQWQVEVCPLVVPLLTDERHVIELRRQSVSK
ncbi:MAG: 16S rRNA (guanine(527)-N(7))-methyltransferase RsmG [Woeseiaceae bacterium]